MQWGFRFLLVKTAVLALLLSPSANAGWCPLVVRAALEGARSGLEALLPASWKSDRDYWHDLIQNPPVVEMPEKGTSRSEPDSSAIWLGARRLLEAGEKRKFKAVLVNLRVARKKDGGVELHSRSFQEEVGQPLFELMNLRPDFLPYWLMLSRFGSWQAGDMPGHRGSWYQGNSMGRFGRSTLLISSLGTIHFYLRMEPSTYRAQIAKEDARNLIAQAMRDRRDGAASAVSAFPLHDVPESLTNPKGAIAVGPFECGKSTDCIDDTLKLIEQIRFRLGE